MAGYKRWIYKHEHAGGEPGEYCSTPWTFMCWYGRGYICQDINCETWEEAKRVAANHLYMHGTAPISTDLTDPNVECAGTFDD
jgi:hypothetical protein